MWRAFPAALRPFARLPTWVPVSQKSERVATLAVVLEFEARASRHEPWPVLDQGGEARGGGMECAARGARAFSEVPNVNLSSFPEYVLYV